MAHFNSVIASALETEDPKAEIALPQSRNALDQLLLMHIDIYLKGSPGKSPGAFLSRRQDCILGPETNNQQAPADVFTPA